VDLKSNFYDVQAFHDKFGLDRDRPATPRLLPSDLLRFRLGFLVEELAEFAEASGAFQIARALEDLAVASRVAIVDEYDANRSLVRAFDALLDLNVVSCGTADFLGVPWEAGWDAVMRCNLAKRRAKSDGSDSKRGSPFDVVKPAGWVGPEAELARLLRDASDGQLQQVRSDR
jgi:predicted HAD superfamily Cof-like phosphohydrolase